MNKKSFGLKIRAIDDGPDMTFSGYGAVFGNVDSYGDVIVKGAFTKTLKNAAADPNLWPKMLLQHGGWGIDAVSTTPIGSWLDLKEDDYGLLVEGQFGPTTRGVEAYELLKMKPRPAINGLSIGFNIPPGGKEDAKEPISKNHKQNITEIDLWEVSLVTFPANGKARVLDVKSARPRDFERCLRDACGLSRKEAAAFMHGGWKALQNCCDNGDVEDYSELAAIIRRNIKILSGETI